MRSRVSATSKILEYLTALTISRRLCKWRKVAATIPGTPAILSRKRILCKDRRNVSQYFVRMRNGSAIETYAEPRLIIEDIPFRSQLLDRPTLPVGWKRLVLVARNQIEHLSCKLYEAPSGAISKCLWLTMDDLFSTLGHCISISVLQQACTRK